MKNPREFMKVNTDATFTTAINYNSSYSCNSSLVHGIEWKTKMFKSLGNPATISMNCCTN